MTLGAGSPHDDPNDAGWADGNLLAGSLSEIFAAELTGAIARCAGCGETGALAQLRVYPAAGLVGRCPNCGDVLLRLVRAPGRAYLDMRGISLLEVALPDPG